MAQQCGVSLSPAETSTFKENVLFTNLDNETESDVI